MVTVAAAPASARRISETAIKRECKAANGGTYGTEVITDSVGVSRRFSTCTYRDIGGAFYTDYYVNGQYNYSMDW